MNAGEIISKLGDFGSNIEIAYEDFDKKEVKEALGEFSMVASRGGSDQGTEWWVVYYFKEHDVYIKYDGYYTSYDGVSDIEAFEVFPKEVTVTVYGKKK